MASDLWTPEGVVSLQKDVVPINRRELQALSWLHEFASNHGISLVCKKCDSAILGKNNGQEQQPAVACKCREFRYTGG